MVRDSPWSRLKPAHGDEHASRLATGKVVLWDDLLQEVDLTTEVEVVRSVLDAGAGVRQGTERSGVERANSRNEGLGVVQLIWAWELVELSAVPELQPSRRWSPRQRPTSKVDKDIDALDKMLDAALVVQPELDDLWVRPAAGKEAVDSSQLLGVSPGENQVELARSEVRVRGEVGQEVLLRGIGCRAIDCECRGL